MSNRSLLEFNHDLGPRPRWPIEQLADYANAIARYLGSGDKSCLPDGVTFIQMRHHSDPEPTGWVPPQDRKAGYRCLAFMGDDWRIASWNIDAYSKRPRPFWDADGWRTMASREHPPTHFAPLPDAPQTGEAGRG